MRGWLNTPSKVEVSHGWAAWGLVTPLHTWGEGCLRSPKELFWLCLATTWHSPVPEILMHSALEPNSVEE